MANIRKEPIKSVDDLNDVIRAKVKQRIEEAIEKIKDNNLGDIEIDLSDLDVGLGDRFLVLDDFIDEGLDWVQIFNENVRYSEEKGENAVGGSKELKPGGPKGQH